MDLRSGCSLPREPPRGARRRCRQRACCPCCDTDGADRISGLPDSVLLRILAGVRCARTAAHAGGISLRWRGLWRRLPELHIHGITPDAVVTALAQVALPELSVLDINVPKRHKFSAAGVASLLRTAARLSPVDLTVIVWVNRNDRDVAVELPCFGRAASIKLELGDVRLAPPPVGGEFPVLERLSFSGCKLSIDGLISQCPRLRALEFRRSTHCDMFRVHSTTIEELVVDGNGWMRGADIVAPVLKKFTLKTFVDKDFSISFSTPVVENLLWHCYFSGAHVGIDGVWCLSNLKLSTRKIGYILRLDMYIRYDTPYAWNLHEIAHFPVLELSLLVRGHAFAAVVLNILGTFTAIQSLKLDIQQMRGMEEGCPPNCHCGQLQNQQSQNPSLTTLKELEMKNVEGSDHDIDFLKLVLTCAPNMKRVTVKLAPDIIPNEIREDFCNIFRVYPSVKWYAYDSRGEELEFDPESNRLCYDRYWVS